MFSHGSVTLPREGVRQVGDLVGQEPLGLTLGSQCALETV